MTIKSFSIELSNEAENDLDKSYEFYFKDSPKVADKFFRQINLSLERIRKNPQSFPIAHKEIRKLVLKKFPFVIYYRIFDTVIQIIAIFHTSRNPEIWSERK